MHLLTVALSIKGFTTEIIELIVTGIDIAKIVFNSFQDDTSSSCDFCSGSAAV